MTQWQRLDPRMLLIHPINEVVRFLPALAGLFIAGAASGMVDLQWQLIGVLVPVVLGLLRYLTTYYRISGEVVELRRGVLDRHLLSTRIERVRTVDLTSSLIHRALGLTTVRIGTGTASTSDEDRIDLDGLPVAAARELRLELLRMAAPMDEEPDAEEAPPAAPLLVLDPSWARFAPATLTGVALTAAVLGVGAQGLQLAGGFDGGGAPDDGGGIDGLVDVLGLMLIPLALVVTVTVVTLVSIAGYLISNWGFTLTHDRGAWHLRRGLLTTRETSLDDERLAGLSVGEPVGLRLVGAARLSAIVTGLGSEQRESALLVPPAPREVVDGVAGAVIDNPAALTGPLTPHGPAAVRRRWLRALVPATVVAVACLALLLLLDGWTWLLVPAVAAPALGAALAYDRAEGLGHALVDGHLVARSGSLLRQRQVLDVDDVIGWTFRATWFQRRVGLTTLVATTAGGPQAVTLLDVPETQAAALSQVALPDLVSQFCR